MTHEGQERCSKKRQETDGSSLSQAPNAHSKNLAKRERPSSLREESSPKDFPRRGGTPESPNELECLKIRSPVARTNREVVNYSKQDPMNLVTHRNKPCYNFPKERGTDERLWTFFHHDWYQTVLYLKTSPVVKHQFVHIDYVGNKKDMHFNRILEACDLHGITDLL
jgi:hypothetical protein